MANPTPRQVELRDRFEALIALAAPALDLILAVGDRIARITGPPAEYYPIRPPGEAFELAPPPRSEPPAEGGDSA